MKIQRKTYLDQLAISVNRSRITAILGPRQAGKTSLARDFSARQTDEVHWFDAESHIDRASLQDPIPVLGGLRGLVVIDEIQRLPELFQALRVLADRESIDVRFLILGSASPDLIRGASESLAGRVEFCDLTGFRLSELEPTTKNLDALWLRGGFPMSYKADSDQDSLAWRNNFIRTFLEQDLRALAPRTGIDRLANFWKMLAHFHGQVWNAASLGNSLGIDAKSVSNYLELMTKAYMVRQLQPWTANTRKRLRKSPKIYLRDSGLLHALLGVQARAGLDTSPAKGASWEGFALEQVMGLFDLSNHDIFAWGTHGGAELDLLFTWQKKRIGVEFKVSPQGKTSKSMRIAQDELDLAGLFVVHSGVGVRRLDTSIVELGLLSLREQVEKLTD